MIDEHGVQDILGYWFGELDGLGMSSIEQQKLWFISNTETDQVIREGYLPMVEKALAGELDGWAGQAQSLVALVILLDQFTRNIFRGSEKAFAGDSRALLLAQAAVATGMDRTMPTIHRVFLYIPFEHAENLAIQDQGVSHFDGLLQDCSPQVYHRINSFRDYSVAHREVIETFGRFPHRNKILGRDSTAEERAHLVDHGGF